MTPETARLVAAKVIRHRFKAIYRRQAGTRSLLPNIVVRTHIPGQFRTHLLGELEGLAESNGGIYPQAQRGDAWKRMGNWHDLQPTWQVASSVCLREDLTYHGGRGGGTPCQLPLRKLHLPRQ